MRKITKVGIHDFKADGHRWISGRELSGPTVGERSIEFLEVDETLPTLAVDSRHPAALVAIPWGRFVGIGTSAPINGGANPYRLSNTHSGNSKLTISDGKNINPVGMSTHQMFKSGAVNFGEADNTVGFRRQFKMEVPYATAYNDAHGGLISGDSVMPFFGSVVTSDRAGVDFRQVGKPVRFLSKGVFHANTAASGSVGLTSAIYASITPKVVYARNGATFVSASATALSFNVGAGYWVASFSSPVTDVDYTWGAEADMRAGEVVRIESLSNIQKDNPLFRYVESPESAFDFPMAEGEYAVTTVGSGADPVTGSGWETPATVTANVEYRLAKYPLSVKSPVYIAIAATVRDINGSSVVYSGGGNAADWLILPTDGFADARGWFTGRYHSINPSTGVIKLSSNISNVTAVRAQYTYITNPIDGIAVTGSGISQLTRGEYAPTNNKPSYGIPAHLNTQGTNGAMRLYVY